MKAWSVDYMSYVIKTYFRRGQSKIKLPSMFQYDHGNVIHISGIPDDGGNYILDAVLEGDEHAYSTCEYKGNGLYSLKDDLFKDGRNIVLYLFADYTNWGRNLQEWTIPIIRRPKPDRSEREVET